MCLAKVDSSEVESLQLKEEKSSEMMQMHAKFS